jgi:ribosome recycling factor
MLSRLLRKTLPLVRWYGNNKSINVESVSKFIGDETNELVIDDSKIDEKFINEFFLDADKIPKHTNGDFHEKIKALYLEYRLSLNSIAGGLNHLAFFSTIQVYTFLEHVPLTDAASVKKTSPTSYQITSYDPNNAPLIETALKKSLYGFNVVRDFGELTVTLKNPKNFSAEFRKTALEGTLKSHKEKINKVLEEAKTRFTKYPQAVDDITKLVNNTFLDMDGVHKAVSA